MMQRPEPHEFRRRDLLDALRAASQELRFPPDAVASPRRLLAFRRRAMACDFELLMPQDHAGASDVALAALDEIESVEALLSIYRPTSELSHINRAAADRAVPVSREMAEFLVLCRRLWALTQGAFDPAAGALVELWGFRDRRPRRPADSEITETLARVGFQHVDLNADAAEVRFARRGIILNPGAIGKGWALDQAAAALQSRGVDNFLIQAGGSSVRACGPGPDAQSDTGWLVGLPGGGMVRLRDAALGTSGSQQLYLDADGVRYSHIIDPRSGRAAVRESHISVRTPSAAEADAVATALFAMNAAEAAKLLARLPTIDAYETGRTVAGDSGDGAGEAGNAEKQGGKARG
ncbi:MAG: hypothetical protein CHACPFDD_03671 [Phycisphaerae bacterium]|nr:hypothetical protein [Phycisphaerae bacterium]